MLTQHLVGSPGKEICVVLHWHDPQSPSVVICPGLKIGQCGDHFMFSYAARQCHRLGMNVFQFDYLGDGDSAGTFEDITVDSLLESAQTVIKFAQNLGCTTIGLVGWGVGNVVVSYLSGLVNVVGLVLLWPDFDLISNFPAGFSPERLIGSPPEYLEINLESIDESSLEFRFWDAVLGREESPLRDYGPLSLRFLYQLATLRPSQQLAEISKPVLVVLDDDQEIASNAYSAPGWTEGIKVPKELKLSDLGYGSRGLLVREEVADQISSWLVVKLDPYKEEHRALMSGLETTLLEGKSDYTRSDRARMCSFSFESDGQQVLGILYVPSTTFKGVRPCVIYEPGFGGNRGEIAWSDLQLVNALVDNGIYVLLYDSRGSGVSAGEFFEITWSRRLQDLNLAIRWLAEIDQVDMNRLAILGWSAGAKTACYVANRINGIRGCVLWSPVLVDAVNGVDQLVRFTRDPSGKLVTRSLGDGVVGIRYFVDAKKYDFEAEFERCRKPMLMIFGKQDAVITEPMRQFVERTSVGQPKKQIMEARGGHLFSRDSLREEVIKASVAWLINLFDGGMQCHDFLSL